MSQIHIKQLLRNNLTLTYCIICITLVTLILYWRLPDTFTNPQFFAEDGTIFYGQAIFDGFKSAYTPYAGYFHLIVRIVALIGNLLPQAHVPALYNFVAWLTICLIVIYLFSSRLPFKNHTKFILGLAIVATPTPNDPFMHLLNIQWLLAFGLLLLIISNGPQSFRQSVFDFVFLTLLGLTVNITPFFMPLFVIRFAIRKTKHSLYLLILSVAVGIIQLWNMVGRNIDAPIFEFLNSELLQLLTIRLGFIFLGEKIYIAHRSGLFIFVMLAFFAFLYLYIIWNSIKHRNFPRLIFIIAGPIMLGLTILLYRNDLPVLIPVENGGRYFLLPTVSLIWALILADENKFRWEHYLALTSLFAFIFLTPINKNYRFQDLHWPVYLSYCRGDNRLCQIPINPVWDPPNWFAFASSGENKQIDSGDPYVAKFDNNIELLDFNFDYNRNIKKAGLEIYFVWYAADFMDDDYVLMLDLYNPENNNNLVKSFERIPLGNYPTSKWRLGEIVIDNIRVQLDSPLNENFLLGVSWFDPQMNVKLPARDFQDILIPENTLTFPISLEN